MTKKFKKIVFIDEGDFDKYYEDGGGESRLTLYIVPTKYVKGITEHHNEKIRQLYNKIDTLIGVKKTKILVKFDEYSDITNERKRINYWYPTI